MDRSVFELFRLDGKVAIVTGAHAWLGYDIACAFAEAGADVIITSRNVDSIRETAAQIGEKYHVDTLALPLDQRKYENVQKMVEDSENAIFRGFSESEICLMKRFFKQMIENLEQTK